MVFSIRHSVMASVVILIMIEDLELIIFVLRLMHQVLAV